MDLEKIATDKVKLLLVDDSPENLIALEATLEGLGQELVTARSGLEALRHLLEDDFAAILLDVRMPDMDGFETATMIRSRKRSRNTPILFLTGYKNEEHLFRGYDLGAVDFLFKPIVPEILQSKVSVFVELSKSAKLLKRQAEDLQRAEASIRAVLEAAPEAMIIFDRANRIRTVNSEAERLFRHTRDELIDRPVAQLSPEWFLVRAGESTELTCVTSEGRMFPAEVSLKPVENAESGLVVSVIRDITERKLQQENARRITLELERQVADRTRELTIDIAERKRAEEALRESEQRLRVAIHAAQLGIWRVDLEAQTMQIGPFTSDMLGIAPETTEISLGEWKNRIHPDDRDAAARDLERCGPANPEYESEYRVAQLDGGYRWVFARGQLSKNPDNASFRIIGVAQDITQRKLAADADRHRQKLESLGILAGGIAHDFNNLLTGILGNASLLVDAGIGTTEDQIALQELMSAAERASQLTRQMLAYSGRGKFISRPISPGREAREIASLIRASIPRNVKIVFDVTETPTIDADKGQLQQLLMNLVINGAEAIGPGGGEVQISTHTERFAVPVGGFYPAEELRAGDYVVIEIKDDGAGMNEETKARIFDPFFTTKFTGRGLGLAAVLGIVRGHRGGIKVDSAPGGGTTFRIYIPVSTAEAGGDDDAGAIHAAPSGSGTILVIDDEDTVRNVARIVLERCGYRVLAAEDGQNGMDLFAKNSEEISLILLDMAMPGISGEETLRRIRELRPGAHVVVSSGFSESEARTRFGDSISAFLQKPYTARQLGAIVVSILEPRASSAVSLDDHRRKHSGTAPIHSRDG
ncbi:MAG TPA: response regulator [Bryobacteraceae bacterium]|nr:response regulator [Bryobacteraceae bacterium]